MHGPFADTGMQVRHARLRGGDMHDLNPLAAQPGQEKRSTIGAGSSGQHGCDDLQQRGVGVIA